MVKKDMPILIVDDYKTMLRIFRNLLSQIGFTNVEEAMDGQSALQKLRDKDCGLIISDWNMEPMSGLQLLKEVRSDVRIKDVPFIMILPTARAPVTAADIVGVSNYIVKPFNAAALKSKMASVLGPF